MDKLPAMDQNEEKTIVTKGNALAGSIYTLANTKDLSIYIWVNLWKN